MTNENKAEKKKINFHAISILLFVLLMLSIIGKDFYSTSIYLNTIPYLGIANSEVLMQMGTSSIYFIHISNALLLAIIVEILCRYVFGTVQRVSFDANLDKYKFITILKSIIIGINLIVALFNFLYYAFPMSFVFKPLIEGVFLSAGFITVFCFIKKKYLNDKSAPVVFISFAIPLAIYLIILAVRGGAI